MWKKILILFLSKALFCWFNITATLQITHQPFNTQWLQHLSKQVLRNTSIRKVILLENENPSKSNANNVQLIAKNIINIPFFVFGFDLNRDDQYNLNKFKGFTSSPTRTLFVISDFDKDYGLMEIMDKTLFSIARKFPSVARSNVLFILFHRYNLDDIKLVLQQGWMNHKILRFKIVEFVSLEYCSSGVIVYHYHPFRQTYHHDCWTRNYVFYERFIKDLEGTSLKIAMLNLPPTLNIDPTSNTINGSDFHVLKMLSEKMNFKMNIQPIFLGSRGSVTEFEIVRKLAMGEIDLVGNQILLGADKSLSSYSSTVITYDQLCALVPVIKNPETSMIVLYPLAVIGFVLFALLVVKILEVVLGFDADKWRNIYIIGAFFAVSIPKTPERTSERIIFACILLLSFHYAATAIENLTQFKITGGGELSFTSAEDLNNSNLTPMIHPLFKDLAFNLNDPVQRSLLKKVAFSNYKECIDMLLTSQNTSCISIRSLQKKILKDLPTAAGQKPSVKILDQCFWSSGKVLYLDPKSPYLKMINKNLFKIIAGGLLHDIRESRFMYRNDEDDIDNGDDKITIKTDLLIIIGCGASVLVFIAEIVVKKFQQIRN